MRVLSHQGRLLIKDLGNEIKSVLHFTTENGFLNTKR